MKPSIIFLLTIFGSSVLIAAPAKSEMIPVATSPNYGNEFYLDTDSITFDRNFVEASVKTKYKNPSGRVSSLTLRWKSNCSYRSKMIIEITAYGLDEDFLWSDREPSGWGAVKPGSVGESIHQSICNQLRR